MADLIDRQTAIDALEKDKAETDHIIMGMSGAEKEFSYHLAQRNQLDCDIDTIKRLPSAEPQVIACGEGELVQNLAEVGTMTNAEAIDVIRDYLVNKVDNEPMQKACQLAIKVLSAEPQTEINMAYMRGKIDGINYCTERLREMRMEVDK